MPASPTLTQELHTFPLPTALEGVDFVDLSTQARDRFRGKIAITPLELSETLSYGDNEVWIKRADLLPGGNFKFLSAMTAVAGLVDDGHSKFTLATAGSYGIGVGHAINTYGGRATAFVPVGSNEEKQRAMRELGVEVVEYGDNFDEANQYAQKFAEEKGVAYLHPFASEANIAGTGILGLELYDQSPDMTHLVLQAGGASLASGVGSVIRQLKPGVHIGLAQVEDCSPIVNSLRSGEAEEAIDFESLPGGKSYFSSLGGVGVGKTDPLTLGVTSRVVDSAHEVRPLDVHATMHDVEEAHKVPPEFSAAVGLEDARELARSPHVAGATIVAILTGAHPDTYVRGYLAGRSRRRRDEEQRALPD